ncbi:hypothetical protein SAMN02745857_00974 [Andreprevotia lacus DSM 23236]|jgi:hypothetical protein|uniref:Uncharacterized protein n=1 Tax=Andreprevotia lacus DSM 23236 TaxID=1121001 RepID=A0A1W1X9D2_9NEIS|nr:hypothetical protein [Andreprevotia lacus]SMC20464.1 hypothetical protein SAMN02745857_00974 [Andreprevotia lacus DSM 23236]
MHLVKIILSSLLLLTTMHCLAVSYDLSDHTPAGARVQTFHIRCANGQFGEIRHDPDDHDQEYCAFQQRGGNKRKCGTAADFPLERAAIFLCQ